MNILWSPEAIEDLNSLRAYIAQVSKEAVQAIHEALKVAGVECSVLQTRTRVPILAQTGVQIAMPLIVIDSPHAATFFRHIVIRAA